MGVSKNIYASLFITMAVRMEGRKEEAGREEERD